MSNQKVDKVTVNIDGKDIQVPKGLNMIEAVALAGKEVPHYCYHKNLTVAGNCRMCLVETGMPMRDRATGAAILDESGKPKISWGLKPAIACATNASEGLHMKTDSKLVKDCQNGVMEFLLVNHPLDCPICDQAGECRLQEFAADYGKGYSRFVEKKVVKPKRTILGPRVVLDDERCILCSRCIRFCQEIAKDDVLGFVDRGSYSTLTCYPGKKLENNYSLNTVDICPVGALTSTDFRFKMRVWFLKRTKSICVESSVGVNTTVFSREGKIYRITPRENPEVNDTWMADSGRELYKFVETPDRLTKAKSHGNSISSVEAFERFRDIISIGKTAYVGSSHMSVEEQFLFKKLVDSNPGPVYWFGKEEKGDGILISADRTPNMRGALMLGLIKDVPKNDFSELSELLDRGEIKNLIVYHYDITAMGLTEHQLRKVNVAYLGTHMHRTSEIAHLAIPTLMVFEKSGSFINQQFRLQKFEQAVPGPAGVVPDIMTLSRFIQLANDKGGVIPSIEGIWEDLGRHIPAFEGIHYNNIPDNGLLLDGSQFKNVGFIEDDTLHFSRKMERIKS